MARTDERPPVPTEPRPLVECSRPRAAPVRLGVIADPHLATGATGTWKGFHRTEALLSRAVEYLAEREVDRVVVPGDLTKDGEPRNVDRFDEIVAELPVPVDVLPGNHDVPKTFDDHETLSFEAFEHRYVPEGFPATRRVGDVTLVYLNSARHPDGTLADTWAGEIPAVQLDRLRDVLAVTETPIVVSHHNLYPLPEHDGAPWHNFPLRNRTDLHAVLSDHDVPLVLSGHHHVPATAKEGGVREVIAPALCSYPNAVSIVDVDRSGTTVELHPIGTPKEIREGYRLASDGTELGTGIARMAADRLARLPLDGE